MTSKSDEVRAKLRDQFGVNPMSGGDGLDMATPVIVHRGTPNDPVGTEFAFIHSYLSASERWTTFEQQLHKISARTIDQVSMISDSGKRVDFYFDVTEPMGN